MKLPKINQFQFVLITEESLEFVVAQFSWYSWVATNLQPQQKQI